MKQQWFCDICQRAGTANIPKHAGIYEAIDRLKRSHDQFSNPCYEPKIIVRDPERMSREEWRVRVSVWRQKVAA